MPELRWILLGLGVLFCIGLWWWETRRQHQAADSELRRLADRLPPSFEPERQQHKPVERPEEDIPPEEPKLELPPDAPAVVESAPIEPGSLVSEALARIEPVLGDTEIVRPELSRIEPPEERIIALRLAAPPLERFEGRQLVEALRAAGLEHGKFSIFHRTTADGVTVFSVASLVEPGTFDLAHVDGRRFPGVSLFAVLPGPLEAPVLLEEMIATARRLAEDLQGTLQDERGAPMNAQRLADLRASVTDWQQRARSAAPRLS